MCQYCQPLIKAIDGYLQKASDNLTAGLKDAGFEEPKKTVNYIESIEDAVTEALLTETDYILAEAEKSTSLFDFAARWQNIKDGDVLDTAIADIFSGSLAEFIPAYVKRYMAETDPELAYGKVKKDSTADRISNRTTAWIQSWSEDLGSMMKLNSSNEIEDILTTGLQNGEGVAWFTQQIMDSGIRDEYYKARRVAVTEVLRAHSVAQQEAFMQDPSVAGKMWKHSGSYRNAPRENHVDMDGQKVAKEEPYTLYGADGGIYYPMYPRDSSLPPGESINCHCISQPLADEDILGMSLEEREQLRQKAIDSMDDEWEKELDAENRARAGIDIAPAVEPAGSATSSLASTGNGSKDIPIHKEPVILEQVDYNDRDAVLSVLEKYEEQIVDSDVENAVVVTKTGIVVRCFGTKNNVFPDEDLGEELAGASVTHNHPEGSDNEYSFSKADISLFIEYDLEVLRGVDDSYVYELTRNPEDIDDYVELWKFTEYDSWHNQVITLAKKLGIGYRRRKRG